MGKEVASVRYSRERSREFRSKVRQGLDVLETMLAHRQFDAETPMTGIEIELNLVDHAGDPSFHNAEVLRLIADPDYQTELARYNIELNSAPRPLTGDSAFDREQELRDSLNRAAARALEHGARIVMIGILPTLHPEHLRQESISADRRYSALNDAILLSRGEDIELEIEGPSGERMRTCADSITPEAACTSVQLHVQVSPSEFPAYWNAAQAISGPQVGLAANSPFFLGKRLHAETRIELFKQAIDTRPIELRNQGVRPRVFFGESWVTSIFDLFEENTRYFPCLLNELSDEDPMEVLGSGRTPELAELRLHNGTIWRWNRPIYDVVDGRPHLRVENRVLPAGPTVIDMMANAAFYYGLIRALATSDRPVWSLLSFSAAADNFRRCARRGIAAEVYWPGFGELSVDELVLRHLLPLANQGLVDWGVSQAVRDRYLTVIEQRCLRRRNGASWQIDTVASLEASGLDREAAIHRMLELYIEAMHSNEPVHSWPVP